jgi:hypothetical protein
MGELLTEVAHSRTPGGISPLEHATVDVHQLGVVDIGVISVALTQVPPTSMSVSAIASVSATVANDVANAGIDWVAICGSAPTRGSFSPAHTASGATSTFTAPSGVPSGNTVSVTAMSATDHSKTVGATVTIVSNRYWCRHHAASTSTLRPSGGSISVAATVANDPTNAGVDWKAACGVLDCTSSFYCQALPSRRPNDIRRSNSALKPRSRFRTRSASGHSLTSNVRRETSLRSSGTVKGLFEEFTMTQRRFQLPFALAFFLSFLLPSLCSAQENSDTEGADFNANDSGCSDLAVFRRLGTSTILSCHKEASMSVTMPLPPDVQGYSREKAVRGAYEFREYHIPSELQDLAFDNLMQLLPISGFTVKYSASPSTITARKENTWILINVSEEFYNVSVVRQGRRGNFPGDDRAFSCRYLWDRVLSR